VDFVSTEPLALQIVHSQACISQSITADSRKRRDPRTGVSMLPRVDLAVLRPRALSSLRRSDLYTPDTRQRWQTEKESPGLTIENRRTDAHNATAVIHPPTSHDPRPSHQGAVRVMLALLMPGNGVPSGEAAASISHTCGTWCHRLGVRRNPQRPPLTHSVLCAIITRRLAIQPIQPQALSAGHQAVGCPWAIT
jgi:hypothetical protein